jgi:hypothetical protein
MKRAVFVAVAVATVVSAVNVGVVVAEPQRDFSQLDPLWAAQRVDASLQSGDLSSAWAALKAVFPNDYERLTRDMATAVMQGGDATTLSQAFIQSHVSNQIQTAQQAPAEQQSSYQRKKADFLTYLSQVNTEACAYLGSGIGDPSSVAAMPSDQMKRYSDLIAATVETIGAGRDEPVTHGSVTADDVSAISAIMTAQGVSDTDAERVLSGQIRHTAAELCRVGVIRNNALAAAPSNVVAKLAFR